MKCKIFLLLNFLLINIKTSLLGNHYNKEIIFFKNRRRKIKNSSNKNQKETGEKLNQYTNLADQKMANKDSRKSCNSDDINCSIQGISNEDSSNSFNSDNSDCSIQGILNKDSRKSCNRNDINCLIQGISNKDSSNSFNSDNPNFLIQEISNKDSRKSCNSNDINCSVQGISNENNSNFNKDVIEKTFESKSFYDIKINYSLKEINKSNFGVQINFDLLFQGYNFFILGDFLLKYKRIYIKFTKNFFDISNWKSSKEYFINIMYMLNKNIHVGFQLKSKSNIKIVFSINLFKNIRLDFFNI